MAASLVIWYTWVSLPCNYPLLCHAFRRSIISPHTAKLAAGAATAPIFPTI